MSGQLSSDAWASIFLFAGMMTVIAMLCLFLFMTFLPIEMDAGERFSEELCENPVTDADKAFCYDRETNQFR